MCSGQNQTKDQGWAIFLFYSFKSQYVFPILTDLYYYRYIILYIILGNDCQTPPAFEPATYDANTSGVAWLDVRCGTSFSHTHSY